MQIYEVTQKILSLGPSYEVRAAGEPAPIGTVNGKLLALTPKLTLLDAGGREIAQMTANFTRTKFTVSGACDAVLSFPLIALKKGFSLSVGPREYKADGGFFGGAFQVKDAAGNLAFEINKQLSLRDRFQVLVHADDLPPPVVMMAAVAIDQKYFQESYD